MVYDNILETIGKTPLVRLRHSVSHINAKVFAKIESFNPGLSAKDRIALHIIEEAENKGLLSKGGTIVEATSGNTGFSIAMVCALKGYKCLLTVTDKISEDKLNNLRAMGAEVVLCPKDAAPNHPNSYYSMAQSLAAQIPGAFYLNQNYNKANKEAHYLSTGPEIWEQTGGKVSVLIGATSTGGTLSGSGAYLKELNSEMRVIAADAYGSVLQHYHQTGTYDAKLIKSYHMEGVGKNIIPGNFDFELIEKFVKVTDKASAICARNLARKEGIMAGYSSGAALACLNEIADELKPNDVVVLIFSDHGSKYTSKFFSDAWMLEQGFLEENQEEVLNNALSNNLSK